MRILASEPVAANTAVGPIVSIEGTSVGRQSRSVEPLAAVAAIVAAFVMVIGCSRGSSAVRGYVRVAPRLWSGEGISSPVLPIFAYMRSSSQSLTYYRAYDILVAQCMVLFGYDDPQQVFLAKDSPPMYRRYGVTSIAIASHWGYHLEPGSALLTTPPSKPPMATLELSVLLGTASRLGNPHYSPFGNGRHIRVRGKLVPAGGCAGQAIRRLHDYGPGSDPALPNAINQESFVQSQADHTVIKVFKAWSRCMAVMGFTFANPLQPGGAFNITSVLSRHEIDTAVTDVTCKQRTHLVAVWFRAEYRLQEAAIRRHMAALTAIRVRLAEEQRAALATIALVRK